MESSNDFATLQRRTEQFLRGLLDGCPANEVPRRITSLATAPEDNPLKQLVRAADGYAPLALASPNGIRAQQPAPRKPKFSLRFSRNKDRAELGGSSSQAETSRRGYQNVFQANVKHPDSNLEEVLKNPPGFGCSSAASPAKPKAASTAATYNCVFCRTDYTTKGTCKRHLEEIHVAKRYFRCIMCSQRFATAPEARKHCQTCGVGLVGYKTEIPEEHKLYSSEFVPHQVFSTQQGYVNHLLDLSVATSEARPVRSYHKKLRNLLEQPACESALRSLSLRLYKSEDAWQNARWEHERVRKAVNELELGILDHESGPNNTTKAHKVERFLETLFADRATSTRATSASPVRERATPVPKMEARSSPEENEYPCRQAEPTPKRPLSFESSSMAPFRQPPGPPTAGVHSPTHHQQQQYGHRQYQQQHEPQHQLLPLHTNSHDTVLDMPALPYSTHISPHHPDVQTHLADRPMMFWPHQEPRPPPYEGALLQNQNSLGHPACTAAGMLADQNFAHLGFDNDFLPFADLSVASRMASPTTYLPSADDAMSFYSQSPQPFAQQLGPEQQPHVSSGMMGYSPMAFTPAAGGGYQTGGTPDFASSGQGYGRGL